MKMPDRLPPLGTRLCVSVPASTSNLGPGYNSLGCALDLWNEFEFEITHVDEQYDDFRGPETFGGNAPLEENLARKAYEYLFQLMELTTPPVSIREFVNIPGERGLGGSSTAVLAGLAAANALLDPPLLHEQLLDIAVTIEGHPDNVAPGLLGGLVAAAANTMPLTYVRGEVHPDVRFILAIPSEGVKTVEARAVLPSTVPFADAVFNHSRTTIVFQALISGKLDLLRQAMNDRLHQPYRKSFYPFYDAMERVAFDAGASGFCVSGAGSALMAVCSSSISGKVSSAMADKLSELDGHGRVMTLKSITGGLKIWRPA